MRAAWLVGLVVVVGCETPVREQPEPARPIAKKEAEQPPPKAQAAGVKCNVIAGRLTSLDLGLTASDEQREPREREIENLCVRAALTKAEADCLLDATNIKDLAPCPKPLITKHVQVAPADVCEQYVRFLERIVGCSKLSTEAAAALRDQLSQLQGTHPRFSQQSMRDTCQTALDATTQAVASLGC